MIGKVTFTMENSNEWLKELNDNKAIMSDPSLGDKIEGTDRNQNKRRSMTTRSKPLTRNGQVSSNHEFRGKLQTQVSKWQNKSKNKNSKENLNWKLNEQNKGEITVSESDGNRSSLSSRGMSLVSGGRCSSPVIGDQNPDGFQDGRASSPAGLWLKSWNSPSNSRPGSPRSLHVKNKWLSLYGNSKWVIIDSYVLNLGLSVVLIATACIHVYWSKENIEKVLQCSLSAYKLRANLCNPMSCGIYTYKVTQFLYYQGSLIPLFFLLLSPACLFCDVRLCRRVPFL